MDILISNLLSESILDFRNWSNGKCANTCICVFSVWPLPKVQNWFQKQIWNENVQISIQFFLKSFGHYLKKSKICILTNGFGHCRGVFSHLRTEIWQNGYIYALKSRRGGQEVLFVKSPFYSPSLPWIVFCCSVMCLIWGQVVWERGQKRSTH